jgi:hypothetical protein
LRQAVIGTGGTLDPGLRQAILARFTGGPALPAPYDALVVGIRDAATQVTDNQVAVVRAVAGSDKAAFEVVMSAAVGAGLLRWDKAADAIKEATDAPQ